MERLRHIDRPATAAIPADIEEFLLGLGGPVAIHVPGRDRSRRRVVVTLLHGNEPSGARAVHAWLRDGSAPATDALLLLASVEAALAEPAFTHRQLAGDPDLNRLFEAADPPGDPSHARLAGEILDAVLAERPEAVVDIHNNSGHNPAYGVVGRLGPLERSIVALFADIVVHYDLTLHTLLEATARHLPSVVAECGRAGDPAADALARRGLDRFLGDAVLGGEAPSLRVLRGAIQVSALPSVALAFGSGPGPGADLVVDEAVDRHNFEVVPSGTHLGWLRPGAPWPLRAIGADGHDRSHELFAVIDDSLVARHALIPIMMTTNPRIALSDCLFYTVEGETVTA